MNRHPDLSLKKPENTSIAREHCFSEVNVKEFFNNLEKTYNQYNFCSSMIINLDETGIPTVLPPPKVVAKKGTKKLGQAASAKRGELVTMIGSNQKKTQLLSSWIIMKPTNQWKPLSTAELPE